MVENGANVAAVNSEGEVPLDIAEEDDMVDFLQQEIDNQGNNFAILASWHWKENYLGISTQCGSLSQNFVCLYWISIV